jgi:NAD+ kinase
MAMSAPLERIVLLHHPKVPASWQLVEELRRDVGRRGAQAITGSVWNSDELPQLLAGADLCITLGGDGSLLRAARVAAPLDVPVLGINLGKLGFLAELQPRDAPERLAAILEGRYWIEERMMLVAELHRRGGVVAVQHCLNEVVVARRRLTRVVRVATSIDDFPLTTYVADGVLVATPTGSTAYALAAGGPILHPEVRNLVLVPISAHLSLRSPLVLAERAEVRLTVETDHEAGVSFDGQSDMEVESGDSVVVRAGPRPARFVRAQDRTYFYHTLIHKLGLNH